MARTPWFWPWRRSTPRWCLQWSAAGLKCWTMSRCVWSSPLLAMSAGATCEYIYEARATYEIGTLVAVAGGSVNTSARGEPCQHLICVPATARISATAWMSPTACMPWSLLPAFCCCLHACHWRCGLLDCVYAICCLLLSACLPLTVCMPATTARLPAAACLHACY